MMTTTIAVDARACQRWQNVQLHFQCCDANKIVVADVVVAVVVVAVVVVVVVVVVVGYFYCFYSDITQSEKEYSILSAHIFWNLLSRNITWNQLLKITYLLYLLFETPYRTMGEKTKTEIKSIFNS